MHPFERRQVLVEEGVGGDQRPKSDQQPLTAQRIAWQEARGKHALRIVARWSDRHRNAVELPIFSLRHRILGCIVMSRPRSRNGGSGSIWLYIGSPFGFASLWRCVACSTDLPPHRAAPGPASAASPSTLSRVAIIFWCKAASWRSA